jgi:hypothetical protein
MSTHHFAKLAFSLLLTSAVAACQLDGELDTSEGPGVKKAEPLAYTTELALNSESFVLAQDLNVKNTVLGNMGDAYRFQLEAAGATFSVMATDPAVEFVANLGGGRSAVTVHWPAGTDCSFCDTIENVCVSVFKQRQQGEALLDSDCRFVPVTRP